MSCLRHPPVGQHVHVETVSTAQALPALVNVEVEDTRGKCLMLLTGLVHEEKVLAANLEADTTLIVTYILQLTC